MTSHARGEAFCYSGVAEGRASVVDHAPDLLVSQAAVLPCWHGRTGDAVAHPVEELAIGVDAGRHVDMEVGRAWHQSKPGRSVAPPRFPVTGLAVRSVDISTDRQRALVRRYRIANVDHVERYAGALFGAVHIAAAREYHSPG